MTAIETGRSTTPYALVPRAAPFATLPQRRTSRPGHARRPLPVRRVRRAPAAPRVGPRRPARSPAARRAAARGHQRRHDPRPRPVRRLPRWARRRSRGSASSTRRWSTSRASATCSPSAPQLADRGHHPRPGAGHARRRVSRGGCRSGRATRSAGPPSWAARSARSSARSRRCPATRPRARPADGGPRRRGRPATCSPTSRSSARRPARCPTTAPSSSSGSATSSATGGCAALAVRRAGARAVGAGDRGAAPRAVRRRRPGMHADDGIVLRLPDADDDAARRRRRSLFDPDEIEALVTDEVGGSALFASRFRECAARALLLPRRDPGRRSPLWQQRQRSAQLLTVAAQYGSFPIVLETMRECLQDVFDVPGAGRADARRSQRREVRVVEVETPDAVAVRPLAAVRLRRRVHVRGRRAARRTPRRGAVARPGPARRAARPGRAARAARRRRARPGRARAAAARRRPAARATPRAWPTCCGCSAR